MGIEVIGHLHDGAICPQLPECFTNFRSFFLKEILFPLEDSRIIDTNYLANENGQSNLVVAVHDATKQIT